ncbi:biopolymer transporter ExbD [Undibacterium jejuense]|uniref:Biopolymer transporter ExbD n=1 Tax=Undibacterium jejuense TaxID=1344949 RepID=A0A923HKR3_9BURK|nr:biopolymer transporter ExbD [Undibacterium jejuense]MBC3861441.1 biopolymer transporter ExbD [Undibacterium jejuense]
MAFGQFNERSSSSKPMHSMADINVTPMVDVMLVLLVIFIIAAPLMTPVIKLDLPKAAAKAAPQPTDVLHIAIDSAGLLYWNDQQIDFPALELKLESAGRQAVPPDLQLRADKSTRYEMIAKLMSAAQSKGVNKISFVTDTPK